MSDERDNQFREEMQELNRLLEAGKALALAQAEFDKEFNTVSDRVYRNSIQRTQSHCRKDPHQ